VCVCVLVGGGGGFWQLQLAQREQQHSDWLSLQPEQTVDQRPFVRLQSDVREIPRTTLISRVETEANQCYFKSVAMVFGSKFYDVH